MNRNHASAAIFGPERFTKTQRGNASQWKMQTSSLPEADYLRDELLEHVKEIARENGVGEPKSLAAGAGVKVVSVSESIRKTLDIDRLKAEHPEIPWDEYYKVSSSTTVRLGKV